MRLSKTEAWFLAALGIASGFVFAIANHIFIPLARERVMWMCNPRYIESILKAEPSPWTLFGYGLCSGLGVSPLALMYFHALIPMLATLVAAYLVLKKLKFALAPAALALTALYSAFGFQYNMISGLNEPAILLIALVSLWCHLDGRLRAAWIWILVGIWVKITTLFLIFPQLVRFRPGSNRKLWLKLGLAFIVLNLPLIRFWVKNYRNYFVILNYPKNAADFLVSLPGDYPLFTLLAVLALLKPTRELKRGLGYFLAVLAARSLLAWGGIDQQYYNLSLLIPMGWLAAQGARLLLARVPSKAAIVLAIAAAATNIYLGPGDRFNHMASWKTIDGVSILARLTNSRPGSVLSVKSAFGVAEPLLKGSPFTALNMLEADYNELTKKPGVLETYLRAHSIRYVLVYGGDLQTLKRRGAMPPFDELYVTGPAESPLHLFRIY